MRKKEKKRKSKGGCLEEDIATLWRVALYFLPGLPRPTMSQGRRGGGLGLGGARWDSSAVMAGEEVVEWIEKLGKWVKVVLGKLNERGDIMKGELKFRERMVENGDELNFMILFVW